MSLGSDDVSIESKRIDEPACDLCVICQEPLDNTNPHRALVKLASCGHQFHLDCLGSEFNAKNQMICPTCRNVEQGRWLLARPQNLVDVLIRMAEERQIQLGVNSILPLTDGLATGPVWDQPAVLPSVQPQHDAIVPSPGYPARSTSSLRFSLDYTPQQQEMQQQQIESISARVRAANEHRNLMLHDFESSLAYTPQQVIQQSMERTMARTRAANEHPITLMTYGFNIRRSNNGEGGNSRG